MCDIREKWLCFLQDLEAEDVYLLYENFNDKNCHALKVMKEDLMRRFRELETS